mgnify:CR=1 FL=1
MKKTLVALAAAAAISPAAFAGDVSWGGDANVEGFMNRVEGEDDTVSDARGYTNRIRLKGTFKTDGNVSVNTRLILNDSAWTGDSHSGVEGVYQNSGNDAVAVDYGFIQAPIAGWTFRFGRQVANWANCFLTCDDRRDRILAMKRFGSTTLILLNDKRNGGVTPDGTFGMYLLGDPTNEESAGPTGEGDLYTAAAVGVIKGWQWGLLLGKWIGEEGYLLDEVYAISPFVKGKAGNVKLEGAINILGGGEDDWAAFRDTAISAYIKAGIEVSSINLEAQAVIVDGGGLIAPGFDTFTMFINNNPDNNLSNVSQFNLGGLGRLPEVNELNTLYTILGDASKAAEYSEYGQVRDQVMLGFRASGKINKFGWKASTTYTTSEINEFDVSWDIFTLEGGVTYAVSKTTELYANAGIASVSWDDDADEDTDHKAATVGINTTF